MFFKRKSFNMLVLLVALCLFVFTFSGCGAVSDNGEQGEQTSVGQPSGDSGNRDITGSINVVGSTSVQPVSDLLAEAFMNDNPDATVHVQGGGSTTGIRAADDGAAEIGATSRDLYEDEKHLEEYVIGQDGIAVVVHPSSNVSDLSLEDIKNIYAGDITSWSEVGDSEESIHVVTREEGSGTRGAFEDIVMGDNSIHDRSIVQNSTGAIASTVAGDENAIGYISLAALDENVKALKVGGAEATSENIASGSYEVSRPFIYVTKGAPSELAESFLDYVMSPEAQSVIEEAGLISVN